MTVIERRVYVCDIHGETANVVGMGGGPPWCVECRAPVKVVRLVPDDQLRGAVNLDDEAVIERATRALCDEEWWEDDWMTAMNVVGIVFQAAKGGQ
jgi:hypothetical protein